MLWKINDKHRHNTRFGKDYWNEFYNLTFHPKKINLNKYLTNLKCFKLVFLKLEKDKPRGNLRDMIPWEIFP